MAIIDREPAGSTCRPPDGYLDAAGGQPPRPEVLQAWERAARQGWADTGALHGPGRQGQMLLEAARASLATSLSACIDGPPIRPEQIWLTASGDQARDALLGGMPGPLVTGAVETVPILQQAESRPGSTVVGVDAQGRVDAQACALACTQTPGAVLCLQLANAEVGTVQSVIPRPEQVPWIADATACIGRIQIPDGWSAIWASADDWAAPGGLGVAVIRDARRWHRPTGAVRGWIGGSCDVPAAVAAAIAAEGVVADWRSESVRATGLIDLLREQVPARVPDVEVVGDPVNRLPHVLTFSVLYVSGEALVGELDRAGFAVASGSACVAEEQRPSHVLAAMGAYTGGNIRITLPFGCSADTVHGFLAALAGAVGRLRAEVGR
jgi:cysteine desulfurase